MGRDVHLGNELLDTLVEAFELLRQVVRDEFSIGRQELEARVHRRCVGHGYDPPLCSVGAHAVHLLPR